ncbi:hypothetical protein PVAG01_07442 [Phlyctema vagabunda]|uniref:Uncharacterized protein n=1 Tax=Phlyctema vagabunda TaxID=108571 RepID=A0ABR4PCW1_9HELO
MSYPSIFMCIDCLFSRDLQIKCRGLDHPFSMAGTRNSSTLITQDVPSQINSTFICGIGPDLNPAFPLDGCPGPSTNIIAPAPTSGPRSASWPVTCLANCSVLNHPSDSSTGDEAAATANVTPCCLGHGTWDGNLLGTALDRTRPDGCEPDHELSRCSLLTTSVMLNRTTTVSGSTPSQSRAVAQTNPKSIFALIILTGVLVSAG